MHHKYTDMEVIGLIRANDRRGFEYLYSLYAPLLFRVINKIVGSSRASEGILEQVFCSMWTHSAKYDARRSLYLLMHIQARELAVAYMEGPGVPAGSHDAEQQGAEPKKLFEMVV